MPSRRVFSSCLSVSFSLCFCFIIKNLHNISLCVVQNERFGRRRTDIWTLPTQWQIQYNALASKRKEGGKKKQKRGFRQQRMPRRRISLRHMELKHHRGQQDDAQQQLSSYLWGNQGKVPKKKNAFVLERTKELHLLLENLQQKAVVKYGARHQEKLVADSTVLLQRNFQGRHSSHTKRRPSTAAPSRRRKLKGIPLRPHSASPVFRFDPDDPYESISAKRSHTRRRPRLKERSVSENLPWRRLQSRPSTGTGAYWQSSKPMTYTSVGNYVGQRLLRRAEVKRRDLRPPKRRRRKKAIETLQKTKEVTTQKKNSTLLRQRNRKAHAALLALKVTATLQRYIRGFLARRMLQNMNEAAEKIQKCWRGRIGRKIAAMKRSKLAQDDKSSEFGSTVHGAKNFATGIRHGLVNLQARFRGKRDRAKTKKARNGIVNLQARWRGRTSRKNSSEILHKAKRGLVNLQARFRGKRERAKAKKSSSGNVQE